MYVKSTNKEKENEKEKERRKGKNEGRIEMKKGEIGDEIDDRKEKRWGEISCKIEIGIE